MEVLIFLLGLLSGAIITLAIICVLAIKTTYKKQKGDNQ